MSSQALANKIAHDLIIVGSTSTPCHRIQFKGGSYPDNELDQGGLCESALAKEIKRAIDRHLANTA